MARCKVLAPSFLPVKKKGDLNRSRQLARTQLVSDKPAEAEALGEMQGVMTHRIISPDIFLFIVPSLLREICCSSPCGLINIPEESIKRDQQPVKDGVLDVSRRPWQPWLFPAAGFEGLW